MINCEYFSILLSDDVCILRYEVVMHFVGLCVFCWIVCFFQICGNFIMHFVYVLKFMFRLHWLKNKIWHEYIHLLDCNLCLYHIALKWKLDVYICMKLDEIGICKLDVYIWLKCMKLEYANWIKLEYANCMKLDIYI